MKKQKTSWSALRYLAYFTQFGIAMITPPLLLTFGGVWLKNRFGWGNGIVIAGLICGVAVAARSVYEMLRFVEKQARESSARQKREEEEVLHDDKRNR